MNEPAIVIVAGGRGERFWPLSRKNFPKQLLPLLNGQSLLQAAVGRIRGLVNDQRLVVVVNRDYAGIVREQLPMLAPENLIVEPESRNTAPAIGLAALTLEKRFGPDLPLLFLPSDLEIAPEERYRELVKAALQYGASGRPLVGGTRPIRPDTGYGYIRIGAETFFQGLSCYEVMEFKEKPGREKAEAYVASGEYLWHAGIFACNLGWLLMAYRQWLPELLTNLKRLLPLLEAGDAAGGEGYVHLPLVSFDEGILEQVTHLTVIVGDYTWNDLGSWNAWAERWAEDGDGNRVHGQHLGLDTERCLIYSPGKPVVTFGVTDLLIIDAGDTVMVCSRDRIPELKKLIDHLRMSGGADLL